MKTQSTPGPWNITEEPDHDGTFYAIRNRRGYLIATTATHDLTKEREANARLIASAPQLLEALEDILSWPCASKADEAERFWAKYAPEEDLPDSRTIYNRMIESARAAIAKAKGETL